MNKSKKYYLKEGKLELSILDDEEDEKGQIIQRRSRRGLLNQHESSRMRRRRKRHRRLSQPTLTVSKDVYNTLHAMGQFLTQTNEQAIEVDKDEKETMSSMEIQEAIRPSESNGVIQLSGEQESDKISNVAIESKELVHANEVRSNEDTNEVKEIEEIALDEVEEQNDPNRVLGQNDIDYMVEGFFKENGLSKSRYVYLDELKKHIDKKIKAIREYQGELN